ncbi:MAG TPA: hypothetical protein VKB79_22695 [Bryobacteraceae bacterium]|nr:hypothetical protein [Bryobacteraceae bacterium]
MRTKRSVWRKQIRLQAAQRGNRLRDSRFRQSTQAALIPPQSGTGGNMALNNSPLDENLVNQAEVQGDENEEISLEEVDKVSGGATIGTFS